MPANDYALITCPQCNRSLPPKAANCQFCGASLAGVARPVAQKKKIGPEPWVMTLYYVVAGYWMFGGVKEIAVNVRSLIGMQDKPELQMFSFILYIAMAFALFQFTLGLGLLLKWEWARAVVNFFCWLRILMALLALWTLVMMAATSNPFLTGVSVLFVVLDLVMAGLQIWLISETDYTFMR